MRPTVVIVDDHAGFRRMARRMLEAGGFDVLGEAEDAAGAVAAVRALGPALVLLDVQLPDSDGFAVADVLASQVGAPVVILTSSRNASEYGSRVGRSAVGGFVPKAELSGQAIAELFELAR